MENKEQLLKNKSEEAVSLLRKIPQGVFQWGLFACLLIFILLGYYFFQLEFSTTVTTEVKTIVAKNITVALHNDFQTVEVKDSVIIWDKLSKPLAAIVSDRSPESLDITFTNNVIYRPNEVINVEVKWTLWEILFNDVFYSND